MKGSNNFFWLDELLLDVSILTSDMKNALEDYVCECYQLRIVLIFHVPQEK